MEASTPFVFPEETGIRSTGSMGAVGGLVPPPQFRGERSRWASFFVPFTLDWNPVTLRHVWLVEEFLEI